MIVRCSCASREESRNASHRQRGEKQEKLTRKKGKWRLDGRGVKSARTAPAKKLPPPGESAARRRSRQKWKKVSALFPSIAPEKAIRVSSGNLEVAATEISLHEKQAREAARRPSCRARDCLLRQSLHPGSNNIIPHHHRRGRLPHISAAFSAHGGAEREEGGWRERAMKEEITKIIKSREEVSGGVG